MKLYKSDTKGTYLDITEIHVEHLKKIIAQLEARHSVVLSRLLPYKDAYEAMKQEGPGYLTQTFEHSEYATYNDLVQELQRRRSEVL